MIVLGIDTCLGACSAAVLRDGEVLASRTEAMTRGHQERLAPMVRDVVAEAGLTFQDLDRVGVTVGPGSFTGLRVGLAFAKGLALALGRPCIGVGTLDALASSARLGGPVAAVIDAGRGNLYLQLFDGPLGLTSPAILSMEAAAARLAEVHGDRELALIGPGAVLLHGAAPRARVIALDASSPDTVGRLAASAEAAPATPLYLRAARRPAQGGEGGGLIETILAATPEDADTLATIHAAAFPDPWGAGVIGGFLRAPEVAGWITGVPARGFVLCRRIVDEAEILTLAVTPEQRRRGLGAALLGHAADRARDAGAQALFLEVARDNAAAYALYRAAGFSEVGCRRGYYSRPTGAMDALVLRLGLARRP